MSVMNGDSTREHMRLYPSGMGEHTNCGIALRQFTSQSSRNTVQVSVLANQALPGDSEFSRVHHLLHHLGPRL